MPGITEQILFSGQVQGVGFRWTTQRIASGLPLTGFVRNLPDGRVEVVVSGAPENIQRLIDRLRERFGSGISDIHRQQIEAVENFNGFMIQR
jgi:acylphosphatase